MNDCIWGIGGMTPTGENGSPGKRTCPTRISLGWRFF